MRPIKFRAWNESRNKMLSWEEISRNRNLLQSVLCNEYFPTNPIKYLWKPMQFTGLYDKNGTEIYEGDIVTNYDDKINHRVIVWENSGFWFKQIHGTANFPATFQSLSPFPTEWEIIGNIFESKDVEI